MINKIFVYGTLMRGLYNDYHINDNYIVSTSNAQINGSLYMVNTASYPAMIIENDVDVVYGELYEIDAKHIDAVLHECDILEGAPILYKRIKVKVIDAYGNKHTAYTYEFMRRNCLGEKIESGKFIDKVNTTHKHVRY